MEADFQHERGERLELVQRLEKDLPLLFHRWGTHGIVTDSVLFQTQAVPGKHVAGASAGDSRVSELVLASPFVNLGHAGSIKINPVNPKPDVSFQSHQNYERIIVTLPPTAQEERERQETVETCQRIAEKRSSDVQLVSQAQFESVRCLAAGICGGLVPRSHPDGMFFSWSQKEFPGR